MPLPVDVAGPPLDPVLVPIIGAPGDAGVPRVGDRVPGTSLDPFADQLLAEPPNDGCSCSAEKKKRKKKREPRSVCYRGTYTETSKSLRKVRGERIRCT